MATDGDISGRRCARELLEVIPAVMRAIVTHMRRMHAGQLSVAQFRCLVYLHHNNGASLSELAEHLDLGLPAVSRLIDGLLARGLVQRTGHPADRRRLALAVSGPGRGVLETVRRAAQGQLAADLRALGAEDRRAVMDGLRILRAVFGSAGPGRSCRRQRRKETSCGR